MGAVQQRMPECAQNDEEQAEEDRPGESVEKVNQLTLELFLDLFDGLRRQDRRE